LRFREPVDDRSPEPNNNHTESHSYEEDRPAEPIPEIDLEIPSDSIGNELRDISNLKSNEVNCEDIDKQLLESIVAKKRSKIALLELKEQVKKTMDMLYKESEEDYAKEVLEMASIEREVAAKENFLKSLDPPTLIPNSELHKQKEDLVINKNRIERMTNKITKFNDSWLDTMAKVNQMREDLKRLSAKQSDSKEITSAILDKNL